MTLCKLIPKVLPLPILAGPIFWSLGSPESSLLKSHWWHPLLVDHEPQEKKLFPRKWNSSEQWLHCIQKINNTWKSTKGRDCIFKHWLLHISNISCRNSVYAIITIKCLAQRVQYISTSNKTLTIMQQSIQSFNIPPHAFHKHLIVLRAQPVGWGIWTRSI